jgi:hypothetical protein
VNIGILVKLLCDRRGSRYESAEARTIGSAGGSNLDVGTGRSVGLSTLLVTTTISNMIFAFDRVRKRSVTLAWKRGDSGNQLLTRLCRLCRRDWSFDQRSRLHAGPPEFWQAWLVLDFGIEFPSD